MNCPYCGSENTEGATACTACGQPIAAAPPPPPPPEGYAPPPVAGPAYAPAPQPPAPPQPPQGYAPQPGYGSKAAYAPPRPAPPGQIKSHLALAIIATLFCCMPLGIVGIVFASQVNSKLAIGDFAGAQQASKNAAMWSWISIGVGAIGAVLYIALIALGVVSESMTTY